MDLRSLLLHSLAFQSRNRAMMPDHASLPAQIKTLCVYGNVTGGGLLWNDDGERDVSQSEVQVSYSPSAILPLSDGSLRAEPCSHPRCKIYRTDCVKQLFRACSRTGNGH